MTTPMSDIFSAFQDYLSAEQELREEIRTIVKDIEQTAREILTTLQSIHHEGGVQEIPTKCQQARVMFDTLKGGYGNLAKKIPADQYYRYHDHWRFVIQRSAFLAALTVYLESGQLAPKDQVAQMLGVKVSREDGFHLDLEDYLMGLLQLSSEMSRFAVNSVTSGDYARPIEISRFIAELNAGFRLLNLKNDSLRKRFDALKYDVKKIEEVVYDLTIRGLKPGANTGDVDVAEKA
ncbi:Translin [Blattella germanica]|nr:Translin [Blattella germanica]